MTTPYDYVSDDGIERQEPDVLGLLPDTSTSPAIMDYMQGGPTYPIYPSYPYDVQPAPRPRLAPTSSSGNNPFWGSYFSQLGRDGVGRALYFAGAGNSTIANWPTRVPGYLLGRRDVSPAANQGQGNPWAQATNAAYLAELFGGGQPYSLWGGGQFNPVNRLLYNLTGGNMYNNPWGGGNPYDAFSGNGNPWGGGYNPSMFNQNNNPLGQIARALYLNRGNPNSISQIANYLYLYSLANGNMSGNPYASGYDPYGNPYYGSGNPYAGGYGPYGPYSGSGNPWGGYGGGNTLGSLPYILNSIGAFRNLIRGRSRR